MQQISLERICSKRNWHHLAVDTNIQKSALRIYPEIRPLFSQKIPPKIYNPKTF